MQQKKCGITPFYYSLKTKKRPEKRFEVQEIDCGEDFLFTNNLENEKLISYNRILLIS